MSDLYEAYNHHLLALLCRSFLLDKGRTFGRTVDVLVFLEQCSHPFSLYLLCLSYELSFFTIMASSTSMWATALSLTSTIDSNQFRMSEPLKGLADIPFTNAETTFSSFGVESLTEKAQ